MALPTTTYDTATVPNPSSALTDFTLMVDLSRMSAAWWAAVNTTQGRRGRAAKDDGTELACDWIDFDSVGETGWLRVKWSGTLATSGTQTIRVYPPNTANSPQLSNADFGRYNAYDADWITYWTLLGSDLTDRTANGFDLTADVALTIGGATGKFGAATDFAGAGRMVTASPTNFDHSDEFTIMCWAEGELGDGLSAWRGLYRRNMTAGDIGFEQRGGSDDLKIIGLGSPELRAGEFGPGTIRHHVGVIQASGNLRYDNNTLVGTGTATTTSATTGETAEMVVGDGLTVTGRYWDGTIEQMSTHDVARSAAWIAHEYDQTNSQAAFFGTWANTPVAPSDDTPRNRARDRGRHR